MLVKGFYFMGVSFIKINISLYFKMFLCNSYSKLVKYSNFKELLVKVNNSF